jgi:hypothetical protein
MLQRKYSLQQWVCLTALGVGGAILLLGELSGGPWAATDDGLSLGVGLADVSLACLSLVLALCLPALSVGGAIVVLGERTGGSAATDRQILEVGLTAVSIAGLSSALAGVYFENGIGLPAVSIAVLSSALAGVYVEKVLKRPSEDAALVQPASLWMRSIQLAFFNCVLVSGQNMFATAPERTGVSYFHGFNGWVWLLVALQAGAGMLMLAVIKYADNILYGMASGVSVVVTTMFLILFFDTPLSSQSTTGAVMSLAAAYVFCNPVQMPMSNKCNTGKDAELVDLLPNPDSEMLGSSQFELTFCS